MVKPRRKKAPAGRPAERSDHGTDQFQQQNKGNLIQEGKHKRLIAQSPLDYYFRSKKTITRVQYQAGSALFRDFRLGGLEPSLTPSTTLMFMSGGGVRSEKNLMPATERQAAARQSYRQAMDTVRDNTGKILVENVCCYGFMLNEITFSYYNHSRLLMPPFKIALDELAKHYGIS